MDRSREPHAAGAAHGTQTDVRGSRRHARAWTIVALGLAVATAGWTSIRPAADRPWIEAHTRAPTATFDGSRVTIHDVRDFRYPADGSTLAAWDERTYDLDLLESVWFVVVPFSTDWRGPAHTFLSFGFADSSYLAISVEARREEGEDYSMAKGLLKRFEMLYVIGDERDLIGVRAARQEDEVYLYPVRTDPARMRALLVSMLERANELAARPEFYDTLRRNCTTAILDHVNALRERPIRFGPRILLPGYTDAVALEHGLLDTDLAIEAARVRFRVDDLARAHLDAPDFSLRIRGTARP